MGRSWRMVLAMPVFLLLTAGRCGDPKSGDGVSCGGVERPRLDCSTEAQYPSVKVQDGVATLSLAAAEDTYEAQAIRALNPLVAQEAANQTRLCREYNACAVDGASYHAATEQRGKRLFSLAKAAASWETANYGERKQLLNAIYEALASPEQRALDLTFKLAVHATLPEALGGGASILLPGEPVPTGARLAFEFELSADAYVYMFKRTSGSVLTLFPDPATGVENPLRAGRRTRIPREEAYHVDRNDLGTEHVYVVVKKTPLPDLDRALSRVRDKQIETIEDDELLTTFTSIVPGAAQPNCTTRALKLPASAPQPACAQTRGLVLELPASAGSALPLESLAVRNDLGDDVIVQDFPFEHVTEEGYGAALADYEASSPAGARRRGILMERKKR